MFIYPIVLVAALLFGALTDLSVIYLTPTVTRFYIPLLPIAPSPVHSFASLSLPPGDVVFPNTSTTLDTTWTHYGSCVNPELSSWALSHRIAAPAVAKPVPSALVVYAGPSTLSCLEASEESPLVPTPDALSATIWAAYVLDIFVACGYLTALLCMSLGFAILACISFHRLASVVNVQRMDSPWSFYSLGLLAETSCCCCRLSCAPGLLDTNSSRVHCITASLRPVPPALAKPPCTPPTPTDIETTHRGSRGGKRQHRRQQAQDFRKVAQDGAVAFPPDPSHVPQPAPSPDLQPLPTHIPFRSTQETLADTTAHYPHVWDAPLRGTMEDVAFTSNGRGRVVSVANDRATYINPPLSAESTATVELPTRSAHPTPPALTAAAPPLPPKNVAVRTTSQYDQMLPAMPAITTLRRGSNPAPTLAITTVRAMPTGKLNQRARRALASQSTLGAFLDSN
ncbi:hypothetical protein BD414DRAFT_484888 [Trametes punicea]|nr:hypothetical protein BD414DRAFT_484888 [Trametes punicea]